MGRLIFFLYLCCSFIICSAKAQTIQSLNIAPERTIPGVFSKCYVDNLGNIFVLLDNNIRIKKLSAEGDSLQLSDNLNQYGNIYSMDVTNPLKILVYYKDYATVLILDRFLNAVNTIDLKQAGILQARAVASSYDGNVWVYDEQNAQIKKIDVNGNVLFASTDLRNVFPDAPDPTKIIDNSGQLYLYDPHVGWLLFDYYGAFRQKLEYPGLEDVCVVNNILCGRTGDTIWMYDPKKMIDQRFTTPATTGMENAKQIVISGNKLFVLKTDGLDVYDVRQ